MRFGRTICMAALAFGPGASVALADCPYDHLLVGQDEGTLVLDMSQLYRHWNADWATHPNPYGQEYYEFTEMYGGGYIRVEPGFAENTDPAFALSGTRGADYNILVERVFATPDLLFFDDLMAPILTADGATLTLSNYANHHVHMRYSLPDGLDPTLPYTVSYRLMDTTGPYADSEVYTLDLGAVPDSGLLGDLNGDGVVDGLDIQPFVDLLTGGGYQAEADIHGDGVVDGLDIQPFVDVITGAGGSPTPEPATLSLLLLGGLAVRRRHR